MEDKPGDFILSIENVLEDEPFMMAELMEGMDIKNVGVCLDTGHANCMSRENIKKWIEVLSPYINHFHLHNNYGDRDTHGSFEEGSMNMKEVVSLAAKNCGRQTTYTVEAADPVKSFRWMEDEGFFDIG